MWRWMLTVFALQHAHVHGGDESDEADYTDRYAIVCLALGVADHGHVLPYTLGQLEELDYPKDRLALSLHLLASGSSHDGDHSDTQLRWWARAVHGLYRSSLVIENPAHGNWLEEALMNARRTRCRYVMFARADAVFVESAMLGALIAVNRTVVAPSLESPFSPQLTLYNESNPRVLEVESLSLPLLIDLRVPDSAYLTFDAGNLISYDGSREPLHVFAESAERMQVQMHVDARRQYGQLLDAPGHSVATLKSETKYVLAEAIANDAPILHSPHLQPPLPRARLFGFDKIYVISLRRRPRRLAKMKEMFALLGISFTWWEAVDGRGLNASQLERLRFLPGYEDPYHKRPMKLGEIGCFLSHFAIWEDVVQHSLKKDDVSIRMNATRVLEEMLADLERTALPWHLIYLGRKILDSHERPHYIAGQRHLTSVGYSYWTIAYALSLDGARLLLDARPLTRLLPVDEFLPIMFDAHPNTSWKAVFPRRDLIAYTVHPLIVYPQKYTNQIGYVSDTEDSRVVEQAGETGKDEL